MTVVAAYVYQEHLHPRGADGRWITKFGFIKFLLNGLWSYGQVTDIVQDPWGGPPTIQVVPGNLSGVSDPTKPPQMLAPGQIYAAPKVMGFLKTSHATSKKVGGQAGSNPGGFWKLKSPDAPTTAVPKVVPDKPEWVPSDLDINPNESVHRVTTTLKYKNNGNTSQREVLTLRKPDGRYYAITTDDYDGTSKVSPHVYWTEKEMTNWGNTFSADTDSFIETPTGRDDWNIPGPVEEPIDAEHTWYVKQAKSTKHGRNEALANLLYTMAGVPVPDVAYDEDDKQIYSRVIPDSVQDMQKRLGDKDEDWLKQIRSNFVVDAWLANWDVFGMTWDNVKTDPDGVPYRIDNGGALLYRAQGAAKGSNFGNTVPELDSFRTGKKKQVFGNLTQAEELDGASRILAITPDQIHEAVAAQGLPASLGDTLVARRAFIAKYYDLDLPETVAPPQVDVPEAVGTPTVDIPDVTVSQQKWGKQYNRAPLWSLQSMLRTGDVVGIEREGQETEIVTFGMTPSGEISKTHADWQMSTWLASLGADHEIWFAKSSHAAASSPRPPMGVEVAVDSQALASYRYERGDIVTLVPPNGGGDAKNYFVLGASPTNGVLLLRDCLDCKEGGGQPVIWSTRHADPKWEAFITTHDGQWAADQPPINPPPPDEVAVQKPPQTVGQQVMDDIQKLLEPVEVPTLPGEEAPDVPVVPETMSTGTKPPKDWVVDGVPAQDILSGPAFTKPGAQFAYFPDGIVHPMDPTGANMVHLLMLDETNNRWYSLVEYQGQYALGIQNWNSAHSNVENVPDLPEGGRFWKVPEPDAPEPVKTPEVAKPSTGTTIHAKGMLIGDQTAANVGDMLWSAKDGQSYTYVKKKGPYAVVMDPNDPSKTILKLASTLSQPDKDPLEMVDEAKPKTKNGVVPAVGMMATAADGHYGEITMISPNGKFVFITDASGKRKRKSVGTVNIEGDLPESPNKPTVTTDPETNVTTVTPAPAVGEKWGVFDVGIHSPLPGSDDPNKYVNGPKWRQVVFADGSTGLVSPTADYPVESQVKHSDGTAVTFAVKNANEVSSENLTELLKSDPTLTFRVEAAGQVWMATGRFSEDGNVLLWNSDTNAVHSLNPGTTVIARNIAVAGVGEKIDLAVASNPPLPPIGPFVVDKPTDMDFLPLASLDPMVGDKMSPDGDSWYLVEAVGPTGLVVLGALDAPYNAEQGLLVHKKKGYSGTWAHVPAFENLDLDLEPGDGDAWTLPTEFAESTKVKKINTLGNSDGWGMVVSFYAPDGKVHTGKVIGTAFQDDDGTWGLSLQTGTGLVTNLTVPDGTHYVQHGKLLKQAGYDEKSSIELGALKKALTQEDVGHVAIWSADGKSYAWYDGTHSEKGIRVKLPSGERMYLTFLDDDQMVTVSTGYSGAPSAGEMHLNPFATPKVHEIEKKTGKAAEEYTAVAFGLIIQNNPDLHFSNTAIYGSNKGDVVWIDSNGMAYLQSISGGETEELGTLTVEEWDSVKGSLTKIYEPWKPMVVPDIPELADWSKGSTGHESLLGSLIVPEGHSLHLLDLPSGGQVLTAVPEGVDAKDRPDTWKTYNVVTDEWLTGIYAPNSAILAGLSDAIVPTTQPIDEPDDVTYDLPDDLVPNMVPVDSPQWNWPPQHPNPLAQYQQVTDDKGTVGIFVKADAATLKMMGMEHANDSWAKEWLWVSPANGKVMSVAMPPEMQTNIDNKVASSIISQPEPYTPPPPSSAKIYGWYDVPITDDTVIAQAAAGSENMLVSQDGGATWVQLTPGKNKGPWTANDYITVGGEDIPSKKILWPESGELPTPKPPPDAAIGNPIIPEDAPGDLSAVLTGLPTEQFDWESQLGQNLLTLAHTTLTNLDPENGTWIKVGSQDYYIWHEDDQNWKGYHATDLSDSPGFVYTGGWSSDFINEQINSTADDMNVGHNSLDPSIASNITKQADFTPGYDVPDADVTVSTVEELVSAVPNPAKGYGFMGAKWKPGTADGFGIDVPESALNPSMSTVAIHTPEQPPKVYAYLLIDNSTGLFSAKDAQGNLVALDSFYGKEIEGIEDLLTMLADGTYGVEVGPPSADMVFTDVSMNPIHNQVFVPPEPGAELPGFLYHLLPGETAYISTGESGGQSYFVAGEDGQVYMLMGTGKKTAVFDTMQAFTAHTTQYNDKVHVAAQWGKTPTDFDVPGEAANVPGPGPVNNKNTTPDLIEVDWASTYGDTGFKPGINPGEEAFTSTPPGGEEPYLFKKTTTPGGKEVWAYWLGGAGFWATWHGDGEPDNLTPYDLDANEKPDATPPTPPPVPTPDSLALGVNKHHNTSGQAIQVEFVPAQWEGTGKSTYVPIENNVQVFTINNGQQLVKFYEGDSNGHFWDLATEEWVPFNPPISHGTFMDYDLSGKDFFNLEDHYVGGASGYSDPLPGVFDGLTPDSWYSVYQQVAYPKKSHEIADHVVEGQWVGMEYPGGPVSGPESYVVWYKTGPKNSLGQATVVEAWEKENDKWVKIPDDEFHTVLSGAGSTKIFTPGGQSATGKNVSTPEPPTPEPPAKLPTGGAPSLPPPEEVAAWGGAVTKDGYIPTSGMHVTGKGPMSGTIVSVSKDKTKAVVLTSEGKKSTRLIAALKVDFSGYQPKGAADLPEITGDLPIAIDPPDVAAKKVLEDGKPRGIMVNAGTANGAVVLYRSKDSNGNPVLRAYTRLTKDQHGKLTSELASNENAPLGGWDAAMQNSAITAPGDRLAMRWGNSSNKWKPDPEGLDPTHEVVSVSEPDASGIITVTLKNLDTPNADPITSRFHTDNNQTVNTFTWNPTKPPPPPQPGQLQLGTQAKADGWKIKKGQKISTNSGGKWNPTFYKVEGEYHGGNTAYTIVHDAADGTRIESIVPKGSESTGGFTAITITQPGEDPGAQVLGAMQRLGLNLAPPTQSDLRRQVVQQMTTLLSYNKADLHGTAGATGLDGDPKTAALFKEFGKITGIPDIGWHDVYVAQDESGATSFYWSDRVADSMGKKSANNMIFRAASNNSPPVIVSTVKSGTMPGVLRVAEGFSGGASASSDNGHAAAYGGFFSASNKAKLPPNNPYASYKHAGMMVYYRPETVMRRIQDYRVSVSSDAFGQPTAGTNSAKKMLSSSVKDFYVENGLPGDQISLIALDSLQAVQAAIEALKKEGITHIGGRPIEAVIVTKSKAVQMSPKELDLPPLPPNARSILDI